MIDLKKNQTALQISLNHHHEWLLLNSLGRSFPLKNSEIELEITQNKLLFSFLNDKGFQTWRIVEYKFEAGEIHLNLSRNFGKEREKFRLVPRNSARELSESLELSRIKKAEKIAQIIGQNFPEINIVRVELNQENGRFAQIFLENATLVLSDVAENLTPEILLSTACLLHAKFSARKKNPIKNIWILAEKKQAKRLQKLHTLLRESWKNTVLIKEILASKTEIKDLPSLKISDLWRGKAKEMKLSETLKISRTARKIIEFAPAEIDVVFSNQGETLRFHGLPFARVRKVFQEELLFFGIEKNRRILTDENFDEFLEVIENLRNFRRFDSPNKRHHYYTLAPEAWLESILRKNIGLLDGNLILSPLYHQFRAERDKIDLLALRKDGRLVVIELKTSPDREMIFQAAEYWRKIEFQRRKGSLQKANLFGKLKIADKPAICYLVAPTLSFHRDFRFLQNTISPEIEIFRFDLNENWREKICILQRL